MLRDQGSNISGCRVGLEKWGVWFSHRSGRQSEETNELQLQACLQLSTLNSQPPASTDMAALTCCRSSLAAHVGCRIRVHGSVGLDSMLSVCP